MAAHFSRPCCSVLKIDAEGAEMLGFASSAENRRILSSVLQMQLEVHFRPDFIDDDSDDPNELREDSLGQWQLDTVWVDQSWMVTNIPVELNHVRFFAPTPFVTGQISYHPEDDSYIWYMEFNESLTFTPEDNMLAELQEEGWFQNLYVFEELAPFAQSILLPHDGTWFLGPRFNGAEEFEETWTVLDFSVHFHGAP